MKISKKLFLGFGLYFLLAAFFGFLAYRELSAIKSRLMFLEVADDVTITMLEARRHEKNFLLYHDPTSLRELKKHVSSLKKKIGGIRSEIIAEIGAERYDRMSRAIEEYEQLVISTVNDFNAQEGVIAGLRDEGRDLERGFTGRDQDLFLVLRRHEKNLIIYRDRQSFEIFERTFARMGAPARKKAARYAALAEHLYKLYQKDSNIIERMRLTAREVQSLTVELSRHERADIGRTIEFSTRLLLYSLLTIILIGIVINAKLARSIASPLRMLERISKKVASGDLSEKIEVKGKDEIASLEAAFNYMEDQLKDALASLESTIAQLREKQAQLVQAEKQASLCILAAGIAHEINNPLTSVLTFSHLLLEQVPEDDPRREKIRMITRETARARNIVRQLMGFADASPPRKLKKNLNTPLNDIIESLSEQGSFDGIELKLDLAEDLPPIYADCGQMGQVAMNLLLNAVQSITPPGRVEVATRADGGFVELIVTDTGCGIPREDLGRVFDSFFTTKPKGTGLGLAVSYGIIKNHGGTIEAKSEPGKGSIFTVRLPIDGQ